MARFFGPRSFPDVLLQIKAGLDGVAMVRLLSTCKDARKDPALQDLRGVRNLFRGLARYLEEHAIDIRWPGFSRGEYTEVWFGLVCNRLGGTNASALDGSAETSAIILDGSGGLPPFLDNDGIYLNATRDAMRQWLGRLGAPTAQCRMAAPHLFVPGRNAATSGESQGLDGGSAPRLSPRAGQGL